MDFTGSCDGMFTVAWHATQGPTMAETLSSILGNHTLVLSVLSSQGLDGLREPF